MPTPGDLENVTRSPTTAGHGFRSSPLAVAAATLWRFAGYTSPERLPALDPGHRAPLFDEPLQQLPSRVQAAFDKALIPRVMSTPQVTGDLPFGIRAREGEETRKGQAQR